MTGNVRARAEPGPLSAEADEIVCRQRTAGELGEAGADGADFRHHQSYAAAAGLPRALSLIRPEWHFENRQADLVAEGYDAAIGGGFDLAPGVVARALATAHIVAAASRAYLAGRPLPADPSGLASLDGIVVRSLRTGRIRQWSMRDAAGQEMVADLKETIIVNDPVACVRSRCWASALP